MNTKEFLQALYGKLSGGYIGVTIRPEDEAPQTTFFTKAQLPKMEEFILAQGKRFNTSIGINPRKADLGLYKRGDASDVEYVLGAIEDFDILSPVHKEKALPETKEALLRFIDEIPLKPSILVFSGNGIHAYWLFKVPFHITDEASKKYIEGITKGFEIFLLKKAREEHGWKFDSVADLPRMLRAVGTTNFKTEERPVCSVIYDGPDRYDVSDFEPYRCEVPEYAGTASTDGLDEFALMGTGDATPLFEKCDFMKHWKEDAAVLSEPDWYGGLTILSRAANGRELAHHISSEYPGYTFAETEKKFNHALQQDKPLTCETIREKFGICTCRDCGVKSPIGLIHGSSPAETTWEAPIPFDSYQLPEFPVDALPEVIGNYALAVAEETQTPVDMACVSALSVLSISMQGKYRILGKPGWEEPLNTFSLCIMEPSERKSAVENKTARPLNVFEADWNRENAGAIEASKSRKRMLEKKQRLLEDEVCKGKADASEMECIAQEIANFKEQKPLRLYVDDVTPEKLASVLAENDGRAAILSTEGGIFDMLSGIYTKNVNIDVLLKGYSGDPIRVDRVGRNSETIMNPSLTILLMAQPSVLSGIMSNGTFRGRGLTARFLYCIPKSYVGQRHYRSAPVPEEVYQRYANCITNILQDEYSADVEQITLSPEADRMLEAFAEELEPRLKEEYADISDWAGKLVGNTLRIAGLLCRASVSRSHGLMEISEALVVDAGTMANAIHIGRYFLEHARAAFSLMGADQKVKNCEYVIDAIVKAGLSEFKLRDAMRLCRSLKTKEALQPVLDQLADYGYIALKEAPVYSGKGRPPAPVYLVNPRLFANL